MSRPCCSRCQRPLAHCLCELIPALDSRTRLLILQHPSEAEHALNTARLAALGLRNAQLKIAERFEEDADADRPSYLLFPGEGALPVSSLADAGSSLRLIVPDGTWRKARKLLHVNPWLAVLPRVELPAGLTSRYRLRKAPMPGALSTIEAIVAALDILESPRRYDELLRPFEALIEGQISAMGPEVFQRNHGSR
ncbi:MAG: DTW domain-containing protein [Pseudomonadota bacterium]